MYCWYKVNNARIDIESLDVQSLNSTNSTIVWKNLTILLVRMNTFRIKNSIVSD